MVRSIISARSIPKKFWPEAVKWVTYVMNRCPTHAVKDLTPEEAWSGVKPFVHHFRVFGCLAHVHIPDVHRKKLDSKSIACVLLGESEEIELQNDHEIADEHNNDAEDGQNDPIDNNDSNEDSNDESEAESDTLPPRPRNPPEYLRDYVTGIENI
ncbi:retrovirus-related pol polyprotein from transposon tnt 1-94, partial [Trifolium medium]|nr:retrovirus-related pol polyprotein from transposon tnt 1-94 [Trifolium medium]